MNLDHPNRKFLITGKSGTGKTTLWRVLVAGWPARYKFVFDTPERQYARAYGKQVAIDTEGLNYALATSGCVVFDPTQMFPGRRPEAFAFFCRWTLNQCRHLRGIKVVAIDELQGVQRTGPHGIPPAFAELCDEGRRQEIDLVMVAQRLNQVNDAIRAQCSRLITFQHTDPRALAILEECGFKRSAVTSLPPVGAYIEANLENGEFRTHAPTVKPSHPTRNGDPQPALQRRKAIGSGRRPGYINPNRSRTP